MELRVEFFRSVHTALASISSTPLSFLSYFKIRSMLTLSHSPPSFSLSLLPSHPFSLHPFFLWCLEWSGRPCMHIARPATCLQSLS